ncbi:hypothetical protein D3C81_1844620 [compost metagenome]
MRLHQFHVNRHQPLMESGEHQRQERSRQHRADQETAAINRPGGAVGNGLGDPATERL